MFFQVHKLHKLCIGEKMWFKCLTNILLGHPILTTSRVYGCKNFAGKYMVGLHYQPPCQCRMEAQPVRMEAQPVKEALMKQ